MIPKIAITVAAFVLIYSFCFQGVFSSENESKWIAFDSESELSPNIEIKTDDSGITVNIDVYGMNVTDVFINSTKYQRLTLKGYGFTSDIGKPQIPAIRKILAVPTDSEILLEVLDKDYIIMENYIIYPVQEPVPEGENDINFTINKTFYNQDIDYPGKIVDISSTGILRGYKIIQLEIFPIQYNPSREQLTIYKNIKIKISFELPETTPSVNSEISKKKGIKDKLDRYYGNVISNYNFAKKWKVPKTSTSVESMPLNIESKKLSSKEEHELITEIAIPELISNLKSPSNRAEYLIIVHDSFYNNILPLKDWKESKGLETEIVTTTQISNEFGGLNDSTIRNFMSYAYFNWEIPPIYVLLVGDVEYIPTHYGMYHPYHNDYVATDSFYSTIDGSDYFPDIFIGRLPAKTSIETSNMVNKIINYEKYPYVYETDWYKKVLIVSAYQEGRPFEDTSEYVASFLTFQSYSPFKVYASLGGTTTQISTNINNGRAIVNYRGHGDIHGWAHPSFSNFDIANLNNGRKMPIIISPTCLTGYFDYPYGDSFGERWVKEANKGGVAYFGSSRVSYSWWNDELDKGVYKSIFNDNLYKFGEFTTNAKFYMYNMYGDTDGTHLQFEIYNVLGDPELEFWTDIPESLSVSYPKQISYGQVSNFLVNVLDSYYNPVQGAIVTIQKADETYLTGSTDSNGNVLFSINPQTPGQIKVNVIKHNHIPYEGFSTIITKNNILLVDDDRGNSYETYYKNALDSNDMDYDVWNVEIYGIIDQNTLLSHKYVIWFTGDDWLNTLTLIDMDNIASFLDTGGRLFISGQDIGYDLSGFGDSYSRNFYSTYLHASYITDDVDENVVNGIQPDPITDGFHFDLNGGTGASNNNYPSEIGTETTTEFVVNKESSSCGPMCVTHSYHIISSGPSPPSGMDYSSNYPIGSNHVKIIDKDGKEIDLETYDDCDCIGIVCDCNYNPEFTNIVYDATPIANGYCKTTDADSKVCFNDDNNASILTIASDKIFEYESGKTAGIKFDGLYKVVYLAFPFESISTYSDRIDLMNKTLGWLKIPSNCEPTIEISPQSARLGTTETISWYNPCHSIHTNIHYCTPGFGVCTPYNAQYFSNVQNGFSGLYNDDLEFNEVGTWQFIIHTISDGKNYYSERYFVDVNPPTELNDAYSEHVVDSDDDGLFDKLVIEVGVDVYNTDNYTLYGWLYDSFNNYIAFASTEGYLDTSSNNLNLEFDGVKIRKNEVNGPYNLKYVSLYTSDGEYLDSKYEAYSTASYAYTDFQPPAAVFNGFYSSSGLDTDYDGLYNYLNISIGIDVTKPDYYYMGGSLYDSLGDFIDSSYESSYLETGSQTVYLLFEGKELWRNKIDGPYLLEYLYLDNDESSLDYKENPYNTPVFQYTEFQSPSGTLSNVYNDYGKDTDSDGLYNYLVINVGVNITEPGYYYLSGHIKNNLTGQCPEIINDDENGTYKSLPKPEKPQINKDFEKLFDRGTEGKGSDDLLGGDLNEIYCAYNSNYTYLDAGTQNILLSFNGMEIRNNMANGPYYVNYIYLYDENYSLLDYNHDVYNTSSYSHTQFQIPPVSLNDMYSNYAIDIDNDGFYDYLVVEIGVDVNAAGTYGITVDLHTQEGYHITQNSNYTYLNVGTYDIPVRLSGRDIRRSERDGPYLIDDVYVRDTDWNTVDYRNDPYITSNYSYTEFQSLPASLRGIYSDYGSDTDSDGLYNYLVIVADVNVDKPGNYSYSGWLYDNNGTFIDSYNNISFLNEGTEYIELYFDGVDIWKSSSNGPYNLQYISLYDNEGYLDSEYWAYYTANYSYTEFQVDNIPPIIEILEPRNKSYNTENITLYISTDENCQFIKYKLDNGEIETLCNDCSLFSSTFYSLEDGHHTITVYASDLIGNENYESVTFLIDTISPEIQIHTDKYIVNSTGLQPPFNINVNVLDEYLNYINFAIVQDLDNESVLLYTTTYYVSNENLTGGLFQFNYSWNATYNTLGGDYVSVAETYYPIIGNMMTVQGYFKKNATTEPEFAYMMFDSENRTLEYVSSISSYYYIVYISERLFNILKQESYNSIPDNVTYEEYVANFPVEIGISKLKGVLLYYNNTLGFKTTEVMFIGGPENGYNIHLGEMFAPDSFYDIIAVAYDDVFNSNQANIVVQINTTPTCFPNWVLDSNECINDSVLISYTDINECNSTLNLLGDNGTYIYQDCCTPEWIETNASCQVDDTITGYYIDPNGCYEQTGLESDLEGRPENNTYLCDYCSPSWQEVNTSCNMNDNMIGYFVDSNGCYTLTGLESDLEGKPENNTYICDYCIPDWQETITDCHIDDTMYGYFTDVNICYEQTGLESDLENKPENNTYECDYCTPEWVEINTSCQSGDVMIGYYIDSNNCYGITGLTSDIENIPENNTYWCDFCTPNWVIDQTPCEPDDKRLISYTDVHNCSETDGLPEDNGTYVNCDYCIPNWVLNDTWSACEQDDKQYKNYYDLNECNESESRPNDETQPCDYCVPQWIEVNTSCNKDDTVIGWYMDLNTCYEITSLPSDNNPPENNSYICDYCTPNWIEINGSCNIDDTFTGWFNDANDCYSQTNLESDNAPPENNTHICDFCIPNWIEINSSCSINNSFIGHYIDSNECSLQTGLESDLEGKPLDNTYECDYNYTFEIEINIIENETLIVDAKNETSTELVIKTSSNVSNAYINITEHESNPENGTVFSLLPLGKYIYIKVSQDLSDNLDWVIIRIFYTDDELNDSGINENSLSMYIWNETNSEWEICLDSGVNTTDNYIWANMTHFSVYGGFGEVEPYCGDGSCDAGETCSSCPADCGPCSPSPGGGGTFGGGGGSTPSSCTEDWSCTEWSECINGRQTRTCADLNNCGTDKDKPSETRTCELGEVCAQVITPAVSPIGECKKFLTLCDVPNGWNIVDECPSSEEEEIIEDSPPTGMIIGLDTAIIGGILLIIVVIIGGFYWFRIRKKT